MLIIRFVSWIKNALFGLVFLSLTNAVIAAEQFDRAVSKVDNYLIQSAKDGFSGALLIAHDGEILLSKGYGLANKENEILVTSDTVFDTGSLTKQFTAAAILKLVQTGKVSLDDTLSKYFGDLPSDKKNITIHQLLTHTSGIQALPDKDDYDIVNTDLFFKRLFAQKLKNKPGKSYRYSNAGYSVLGRIIELASGQQYEQFLSDNLFAPLGMAQTGYLLPDWKMLQVAKGYGHGVLPVDNGLVRYQEASEVSWVLKGNGGILSTLSDFYIWLNALANNRILPEDLMAKLTKPYVKEDFFGTSHYAYGWSIVKKARDTKLVTHNGSNGIFYAEVLWLPTEKVQVILLSNMLTGQVASLASEVNEILHDPSHTPEKFDLPKKAKIAKFALSFSGNKEQFVSQLSGRFKSVKKDSDVLNKLGSESVYVGQFATAVKLLEANVSLHKKDGNTWNTLGRAYYKQGDYDAAKRAFEKALKYKSWWSCSWCKTSRHYLDLIKEKDL
jgi:CubicO group peptidase (beta-lactamase class C family)